MSEVLLTTGQLVQALDGMVSARTISRLAGDGSIPVAATTPGGHMRFRADDVREALIDQGVLEDEHAPKPDPDCPECGGADPSCGECCPEDDDSDDSEEE